MACWTKVLMRETDDKVPVLLFSYIFDEFLENHQITATLAVEKSYVRNRDEDFFFRISIFL